MYYRLSTNPTTLDPALIVDVTGGTIAAKLFNGLVRLDKDLRVRPDIAKSWSVSRDGLSYRFNLRKDIKFHNKQYVTPYDFKYSFKRVLDPKTRSPNTWVFEKIEGAKDYLHGKADDVKGLRVIDDQTLEIRLEKPFSPFLNLLTMSAAYVVPEKEVNRWGLDFSSHPVGTGPFELKEWRPNRELRLDRQDSYFDKKPHINGIVYRIINEDLTAMTEFELGNLDVVAVPDAEFTTYRKAKKWKDLMVSMKGLNTYYLGLNCAKTPFNNVSIRRAMNIAVDRRKLLDTYYEGRGRLAAGPVPDLLRTWDTPALYEYDPQQAKDIVQREGFAGATIHLYITPDQDMVDMAEFIQFYIGKTGLKVKIHQLEWSAYKEAINKGEPDMFWLSWWADYPDPEDFLFPLFHSSNVGPAGNRTRYVNPEVDRFIELGQGAGSDEERNSYYERAEQLIVRDAPWVLFWHKNDYVLRQPWIKEYNIYSIYSVDKGTDIRF